MHFNDIGLQEGHHIVFFRIKAIIINLNWNKKY